MSLLEKALADLVGREPTKEEVAKFYKLKETLALSDHDAMWSILLAFGHYETLYGEIPGRIEGLSSRLLADHKLALDETARAAGSLVQRSLAAEVERMAKQTADAVLSQTRPRVRAAMLASIGLAAVAAVSLLLVGMWVGHRVSAADGAWLLTPQGQAARRFSELNNVGVMLDCPADAQRSEAADGRTYCVPFDAKRQKAWGWRVN